MKLCYVLAISAILIFAAAAENFLYGNKNFVIETKNHTEYVCINIKLSFTKFLFYENVAQTASSNTLFEIVQQAHIRFIERVSEIFAELKFSPEVEEQHQESELEHHRGKRDVLSASLGMIVTTAIWYFIDSVRNVTAKLQKISTDMAIIKNVQHEMVASIQTLANSSMENQLRIEEDFGINGIVKLLNGGLHPEFISTSEVLDTFSRKLTPAVFDKLIYKQHPSAIFSFAEVAVQNWDANLEEASLRVCLPAIKNENFYIATNIIHSGFFVEHEFARFNLPETSIIVNDTKYVSSLKNCTMKGLFHLCPSFSLTPLYPLNAWPLNVLTVDQNFIDIQIIDNTYLIATKKKQYYILPSHEPIFVPESGVFALTLNHKQSFLIDGIEPLPGLDKTFYINDRMGKSYANLSIELAHILEKSKAAEALLINGILVPQSQTDDRNFTFNDMLAIIIFIVFILMVLFAIICFVRFCKKSKK